MFINLLGDLIRYIVILIFFSAFLEMILPQGEFRRYLRMFIGILLILTLLTPIQQIVHLVPYWEAPSLNAFQESGIDQQQIQLQGEKMYDQNIKMALQNYHSNIFRMLDEELKNDFDLELQDLQLFVEEDPENEEFGSLQEIYAVAKEPEKADKEAEKSLKSDDNSLVEEISIKVNVSNNEKSDTIQESLKQELKSDNAGEYCTKKGKEIEKFFASALQIPKSDITVKVLVEE